MCKFVGQLAAARVSHRPFLDAFNKLIGLLGLALGLSSVVLWQTFRLPMMGPAFVQAAYLPFVVLGFVFFVLCVLHNRALLHEQASASEFLQILLLLSLVAAAAMAVGVATIVAAQFADQHHWWKTDARKIYVTNANDPTWCSHTEIELACCGFELLYSNSSSSGSLIYAPDDPCANHCAKDRPGCWHYLKLSAAPNIIAVSAVAIITSCIIVILLLITSVLAFLHPTNLPRADEMEYRWQ